MYIVYIMLLLYYSIRKPPPPNSARTAREPKLGRFKRAPQIRGGRAIGWVDLRDKEIYYYEE